MNEVSAQSLIELRMPDDVAVALLDVLRQVGGNPDTTRRGLIAQVARALEAAGVSYNRGETAKLIGRLTFVE